MNFRFLDKLGFIFLSATVNTKDGQPLLISDLVNGGTVEVMIDGEKQLMPAGTWELENGKTITVDDAGLITDVIDTPESTEEPTQTQVEGEAPETTVETEGMTAPEVIAEVTDVVEEVVSTEVANPITIAEMQSLKDTVANLSTKLDELTSMLEEKAKTINMMSEKMEKTMGTKKETEFVITTTVNESDKNKFWYKKLNNQK